MASNEHSSSVKGSLSASLERVDSEYECDLMIEALSKELNIIRDHLAYLTHCLHTSTPPQGKSPAHSPLHTPPPCRQSLTVTLQQKHQKKVPQHVQPTSNPVSDELIKKQGHYLGVVDKMEGERASMRRKCLLLMQVHIEEQLGRVKERGEVLRRRMARRENRIRAAKLKLKPPRFRSSGENDKSFLGNVYISTFYQIIDEEHRLRKSGHLKSLADLKEFWDSMLSPIAKQKAVSPTPQPRPLQSAYSDYEEEYPDSWALTALPPEKMRNTLVRAYTPPLFDEEELKFVPSAPPKMRSIADILDEGRQFTEDISEHVYRSHELVSERKQLHRMYQQARANEMAMRRLLPESPTFDRSPLQLTYSQPTQDEASLEPDREHSITENRMLEQQRAILPLRTKRQSHTKPVTQEYQNVSPSVEPIMSRVVRKKVVKVTLPPVIVPLTMNTALQDGQIIEPKCKSTMWNNYVTVQR